MQPHDMSTAHLSFRSKAKTIYLTCQRQRTCGSRCRCSGFRSYRGQLRERRGVGFIQTAISSVCIRHILSRRH